MQPYDIDKESLDISLALNLPSSIMIEYQCIPLFETLESVALGIVNPFDHNELSSYWQKPIVPYTITQTQYAHYYQVIEQNRALSYLVSQVEHELSLSSHDNSYSTSSITQLLISLIETALVQNASDIHIEAMRRNYRIRYRIHGELSLMYELPTKVTKALLSKIKIECRLDISKLSAQDGSFEITLSHQRYSLRVASMITSEGESMVLRLMNPTNHLLPLNELGFNTSMLQTIHTTLKRPNGLILVTGSTGSGKSTTLYSFLEHLKTLSNKIITVEDPIEFPLPQIEQIEVNETAGRGYQEVLRSLLRLDPDIMMIGEIRDQASLEIAIRSALTGHLVLSTLHTNDAIDTIARLKEMGTPTYLLASTLSLIISQKLVKELCSHCKRPFEPSARIKDKLAPLIGESTTFYEPVGCSECHWSGYQGRTVVAELLYFDEPIKELFKTAQSKLEILQYLKKRGFTTLRYDGLQKSAEGRVYLYDIL
jgi:general secretion pathway protein E